MKPVNSCFYDNIKVIIIHTRFIFSPLDDAKSVKVQLLKVRSVGPGRNEKIYTINISFFFFRFSSILEKFRPWAEEATSELNYQTNLQHWRTPPWRKHASPPLCSALLSHCPLSTSVLLLFSPGFSQVSTWLCLLRARRPGGLSWSWLPARSQGHPTRYLAAGAGRKRPAWGRRPSLRWTLVPASAGDEEQPHTGSPTTGKKTYLKITKADTWVRRWENKHSSIFLRRFFSPCLSWRS